MPNVMYELSLCVVGGGILAALALVALARWWRGRR
jgi:hypothetical protein